MDPDNNIVRIIFLIFVTLENVLRQLIIVLNGTTVVHVEGHINVNSVVCVWNILENVLIFQLALKLNLKSMIL